MSRIEKFQEARVLIEAVASIDAKEEVEPLQASIYNDLAATTLDHGDEKNALSESAKEIRISILGLKHPDTAMTIGNIAQNTVDRKRRLALHHQALEIRKCTLGPNSEWTSWSFVALFVPRGASIAQRVFAADRLADAVENRRPAITERIVAGESSTGTVVERRRAIAIRIHRQTSIHSRTAFTLDLQSRLTEHAVPA